MTVLLDTSFSAGAASELLAVLDGLADVVTVLDADCANDGDRVEVPVVEGASVVDSTELVDAEDVVRDKTEEVLGEEAEVSDVKAVLVLSSEVDDVETVLVLSSEVDVGVRLVSEERLELSGSSVLVLASEDSVLDEAPLVGSGLSVTTEGEVRPLRGLSSSDPVWASCSSLEAPRDGEGLSSVADGVDGVDGSSS